MKLKKEALITGCTCPSNRHPACSSVKSKYWENRARIAEEKLYPNPPLTLEEVKALKKDTSVWLKEKSGLTYNRNFTDNRRDNTI